MIHTFVCVHTFSLIKDMIEQINGNDGVEMIGVSTTLPKDPQVFYPMHVDVFVLDCTNNLAEALDLSRKIKEDERLQMRIVYLFQTMDDELLEYMLKQEEQSAFILAPFTIGKLIHAITKQGSKSIAADALQDSGASYASQVMQNMGLPVHLKGFPYIKCAALLLYQSYQDARYPIKQVYKEVARIHGTTISRVEKAIRTSIDYAERIHPELIHIQGKKPTNSQLIHLVCEQILLYELEKKSEEMT